MHTWTFHMSVSSIFIAIHRLICMKMLVCNIFTYTHTHSPTHWHRQGYSLLDLGLHAGVPFLWLTAWHYVWRIQTQHPLFPSLPLFASTLSLSRSHSPSLHVFIPSSALLFGIIPPFWLFFFCHFQKKIILSTLLYYSFPPVFAAQSF